MERAELTTGERIAWHRRRRGLSQRVLAELVGRTEDWLNKVENGRIQLDRLSVLAALAAELGVPLSHLLPDSPSTVQVPGFGPRAPANPADLPCFGAE
ncbi:helix-turn-helix domain-containing protein [Amycolatopsis cihanbeyliensis]|uniref:helix-turn-helix domain-containing protein n=1 Tax=Amycolatopsis cihanbeyliensis TaxID=1128664 RepID=UPI001150F994